jgi:hypothetical protein
MLANNACLELLSNTKDSSSITISFDTNLNETMKKNVTQIKWEYWNLHLAIR